MMDRPHFAEATQAKQVYVYFDEAEIVPENLVVVSSDVFDQRVDSPQTDERVVLVVDGNGAVRGKIIELAYVVEVAE